MSVLPETVNGGKDLRDRLRASDKTFVWVSLTSIFLFSQIAVNIDKFGASTDLFVYLGSFGFMLLSGRIVANWSRVVIYSLLVLIGTTGLFLGLGPTSGSSLLLFLALYLPFIFQARPKQQYMIVQLYIVRIYIFLSATIAVIALGQLILVNGGGAAFLKNIYFLLPESMVDAGTYTREREAGGIIKANGFFLRESSTLSSVTAFAIVLEFFMYRRAKVLLILIGGLLASISGSGLLALAAAVVIPTSKRSISFALYALMSGVIVLYLQVNFSLFELWVDRLHEFNAVGSSGYSRFVAPLEFVQEGFKTGVVETWFGNGPGSYLRVIELIGNRYEIGDPTWAKLIFEYGIIGFLLATWLFASRLYSAQEPAAFCNCVAFAWLASNSVLKAEFVFLVWLLSLIPAVPKAGRG